MLRWVFFRAFCVLTTNFWPPCILFVVRQWQLFECLLYQRRRASLRCLSQYEETLKLTRTMHEGMNFNGHARKFGDVEALCRCAAAILPGGLFVVGDSLSTVVCDRRVRISW